MEAYRIDKRDFNTGDTITPQNEYQNKLYNDRKKVEEILENNRPNTKPERTNILMLFQNFEDAKNFWTISSNTKFYQIEIDESEILHKGDFNKVEELYRNINNNANSNKIAKEYWEETYTDKPKPEILVNNAVVTKLISNSEEERRNALAERMGLAKNIRLIKKMSNMKTFNEISQDERENILNKRITTKILVDRNTLNFENIESDLPNTDMTVDFEVPPIIIDNKHLVQILASSQDNKGRWIRTVVRTYLEGGIVLYKKQSQDNFIATLKFD